MAKTRHEERPQGARAVAGWPSCRRALGQRLLTAGRLLFAGGALVGFVALGVPKPPAPTAKVTVTRTTVPRKGGVVTIKAVITNGELCIFSSKPKVAHFAAVLRCSKATVRRAARIPSNPLGTARTYTLTFEVIGPAYPLTHKIKIHQAG